MPNPVIIDISHHQPDPIDWGKVKSGGTVGVILKATEGTSYTDPTYASRKQAALAAGLTVSSYHFFKKGNPTGQMSYFLKVVKPVEGERVVIDHETDASLDELKQAVQWLMTNAPEVEITIYSGHTIKDQLGSKKDDLLAENTSLWIAQYTSAASPSWPKGTWPTWSLWQYTDKASVSGISGPVDGNKFNGSSANAVKWMGPVASPPEPEPAPEPTPEPEEKLVTIDLDVPEGVDVRIRVNGKDVM